jgi:hypothetical protein
MMTHFLPAAFNRRKNGSSGEWLADAAPNSRLSEKTESEPSSDQLHASLRKGFDESVDGERSHQKHIYPK